MAVVAKNKQVWAFFSSEPIVCNMVALKSFDGSTCLTPVVPGSLNIRGQLFPFAWTYILNIFHNAILLCSSSYVVGWIVAAYPSVYAGLSVTFRGCKGLGIKTQYMRSQGCLCVHCWGYFKLCHLDWLWDVLKALVSLHLLISCSASFIVFRVVTLKPSAQQSYTVSVIAKGSLVLNNM